MEIFRWKKVIPFSKEKNSDVERDTDFSTARESTETPKKKNGMLKLLLGQWQNNKKKPYLLPLDVDHLRNGVFEETVNRFNPLFIDSDESNSKLSISSEQNSPRETSDKSASNGHVPSGTEHVENEKSDADIAASDLPEDTASSKEPLESEVLKEADERETTESAQGDDVSQQKTENEVLQVLDKVISDSYPVAKNASEIQDNNSAGPDANSEKDGESIIDCHLSPKIDTTEITKHVTADETSEKAKNEIPVPEDDSIKKQNGTASPKTEKKSVSNGKMAKVLSEPAGVDNTEKTACSTGSSTIREAMQQPEIVPGNLPAKTEANKVADDVTIKKTLKVRAKAIEELIKKFQLPPSDSGKIANKSNSTPINDKNNNSKLMQSENSVITKSIQVSNSQPITPPKTEKPNKNMPLKETNTENSPQNTTVLVSPKTESSGKLEMKEKQKTSEHTEKMDQVPEKIDLPKPKSFVVKLDQTQLKPKKESTTVTSSSESNAQSHRSYLHPANSPPKGLFQTNMIEKMEDSTKNTYNVKRLNSTGMKDRKMPQEQPTIYEEEPSSDSLAAEPAKVCKKTDADSDVTLSKSTSATNADATTLHGVLPNLETVKKNDSFNSYKKKKSTDEEVKNTRNIKSNLKASGVTRGDQVSTEQIFVKEGVNTDELVEATKAEVPPIKSQSEERVTAHSPLKDRKKSSKSSQRRSCQHYRYSKNEMSGISSGHCDDYYEKVTRDNLIPRWHHRRPGSWASDMSWEEFVEREYLSRSNHVDRLPRCKHSHASTRSSYRLRPSHNRGSKFYKDPYILHKTYPEELLNRSYLMNHDGLRRKWGSVSGDSSSGYMDPNQDLNLSICSCEECLMNMWHRNVSGRASIRSTAPLWTDQVCTCGMTPNFLPSGRKVKFADHHSSAVTKDELSKTEELPESDLESPLPDPSTKSSENETMASSDQAASGTERLNKKSPPGSVISGGSGKKPINGSVKSNNMDEKVNVPHPWELEQWDILMRQRLLKKRRRRALCMGGMALALVVFLGLIVGIVMVYLRRKSL